MVHKSHDAQTSLWDETYEYYVTQQFIKFWESPIPLPICFIVNAFTVKQKGMSKSLQARWKEIKGVGKKSFFTWCNIALSVRADSAVGV